MAFPAIEHFPAGEWRGGTAQLRLALLRAARDLSATQNHLDCAELLLAAGERDSARLLYTVIFLRRGFSRTAQAAQTVIAAETGLWEDAPWPVLTPPPHLPRFSVDLAIAELAPLLDLPPGGDGLPPRPRLTAGDPTASLPSAVLEDACVRLCGLLRRHDGELSALAELLDGLRAFVEAPAPSPGSDVGGSVPDLTRHLVLAALHDFLRGNFVLAYPPYGSAAVLRAAATLEEGGLRPYFRNVPLLIRNIREVFALIRSAGGEDVDAFDRWSTLLSVHFDKGSRLQLIDELGDLGLVGAIGGQLAATLAQHRPDVELLWRVRDASLDNGAMDLGARAQQMVSLLSPGNLIERTILADIFGTVGNVPAAEAALLGILDIAPADEAAAGRLAALRAGRFERFSIRGGLGTPPDRKLLRMRNHAMREA